MTTVGKITNFIQWADSMKDERTADWLFVSSPVPTLAMTLVYLLYVKWIGPKMMENQKPFNLKYPLVLYNVALTILNFYIFKELVLGAIDAGYSFPCQPLVYDKDPKHIRIAAAVWWYYFSKVIEFIDTVFFVLRKKDEQISFLHVYHHATMPFLWWIGVKWVPGGQSTYAAPINAFVHVVMYMYYGLSALGPEYQKYLWWKKYLTQLQLFQFFFALIHSTHSWYTDCPFPGWMYAALNLYLVSFIFLFGNFYLQAYIRKQRLYCKVKLEDHSNGKQIKNGHLTNGVDKKIN
ncbi:very long chain fatty acid elongase 4-like [Rhopilema esculentum]|uniref:very long chain fatty acid elongase 4-like n=1 Tax=Rhopilema esculentum TaxID=499914 RepID=UPI0031D777B1|eukprot:gene11526-21747_t